MPFPIFNILKKVTSGGQIGVRLEADETIALLTDTQWPAGNTGGNFTAYYIFDILLDDFNDTNKFFLATPKAHILSAVTAYAGGAFYLDASKQIILKHATAFNAQSDFATGLVVNQNRLIGYIEYFNPATATFRMLTLHIDGIGTWTGLLSIYTTNFQEVYRDHQHPLRDSIRFNSDVGATENSMAHTIFNIEINGASDGTGTIYGKWNWQAGSGNVVPLIGGSLFTKDWSPALNLGGVINWVTV